MLLLLLQACSGAGVSSSSLVGSRNSLEVLSFGSDLINPQVQFVSYSRQAGRASIIDPVNQSEVWGQQVENYGFAVAHNNFEQLSVASSTHLNILTRSSSKIFTFPYQVHKTNVARDVVGFSFPAVDSRNFYVIRSLGSGLWQEQSFNIPWQFSDAGDLRSATIMSDTGQELIAIDPVDMNYWYLTANSSIDMLMEPNAYCVGQDNSMTNTRAQTMAYDEENKLLFVGDNMGGLTAISIGNTCDDIATAPKHDFVSQTQILSIRKLNGNELLVSLSGMQSGAQSSNQPNGKLYKITYDINGTMTQTDEFSVQCQNPFGTLTLANDTVLISCIDIEQSTVDINKTYYQLYDLAAQLTINTVTPLDGFAGIGIDTDQNIMYRMREGSLGSLETINLITSETQVTHGLFITDLLN